MQFDNVSLDAFDVVGISVRTSNQDGQSKRDISRLWEEFYGKNIIGAIIGRESNDIYCIYTGYVSDAMGPYTCMVGCKVDRSSTTPEGLQRLTIPGGKYQQYISIGKIPQAVLNTWMEIWQSDADRKYGVDFDVYGQEAQDRENGKVKTFLSVK
jgi:predicted transcriptional regulator YdeE